MGDEANVLIPFLNSKAMYRPQDIKTGLANLIGWRQHHDVNLFKIDNSLTVTETGQYFQEFHPMLTLENIKSIAPNYNDITYPAWSSLTTYVAGDIVLYNSVLYRSKGTNTDTIPSSNPNSWRLYDAFSDWLREKTDSSILKTIRAFWDEKMVHRTARNILENRPIFNGAGRITDIVNESSNFVGFELVPIRAAGVTTKINKIGLQFVGTGEVTLYLYHSSQKYPITDTTVERTKDCSMEWFDLTDWYLPYLNADIDAGGSWYIVYDQAAIGDQQAIKKDIDWSQGPCSTCDYEERSGFDVWSKYLEIHPFKVSGVDRNTLELWDVAKNLYTYNSNYGINLQLTIECDATDLIISQKKAFQSVVGLQLASDMLREFAHNPNFRIGRQQQNFTKGELLYEIDGDSQGYKKSGLLVDLNKAMKAIDLDSTNFSNICFPCSKRGVKYKTI